ncbi:MAG: hypothetical protein K1W19_03330 [Lachnospiraceae bacterium]
MEEIEIKNDNPVLKTNCEAQFKISLADDKIVGRIDGWTMPTKTHEGKTERLRLDVLKKKYPVFSHMEDIIWRVKSGVKVYNNIIMREIRLEATHLLL